MLPNNGRGFGPGGKNAREALGFRNRRKRTKRREERATVMEVVFMRAGMSEGTKEGELFNI
jgi:hypothetical protein